MLTSTKINYRAIFFINGAMLCCLAIFMCLPLFLEILINHTTGGEISFFLATILATAVVGICLFLTNRNLKKISLNLPEAFLTTSCCWIFCCFFASLPFYFSQQHFSLVNALFEATSALTTTGSTILTNLEQAPKSLLFWRALLQWLGGIGIVVMGMVVFPILQIGGMQLFRSEFSDKSEKILPKVSQIAAAILYLYTFFSVLCAIILYLAGMGMFDAFCHAAAIISTGGLSTKTNSISYFNSHLIEVATIIFMLIGGTTFTLYIRLLKGEYKVFFKDSQFKTYILTIIFFVVLTTFYLWQQGGDTLLSSIRKAAFMTVSIITTTGLSNCDYQWWGGLPLLIMFLISFIGGCTGSTSGGIKIFRLQILFALIKTQLRQLRKPNGVFIPMYQGQKISESLSLSVFSFFALYIIIFAVLSIILSLTGMSLTASVTAATASLGNVGAAFGVEKFSSFADLSITAKIAMMMGMIMGRLELFTIVILFTPNFWRD